VSEARRERSPRCAWACGSSPDSLASLLGRGRPNPLSGSARPRRARSRAAWAGALLLLAAGAWSGTARATLTEDVSRLSAAWKREARVEQLPARLLSRGETIPLALPMWATDARGEACTSIAILASPRVSYVVQVASGANPDVRTSEVGAVQLHRCGARRADLRRILIEMRSPRGIVEVLAAEAQTPLASLSNVLAHRDPGPKSPNGQAGPAPIPPPLELRAVAWEAQAKRDGATQIESQVIKPQGSEIPTARLSLAEGCHRLSALGLSPAGADAPRDLDLFLRGEALFDLRREDQSENSDAEISVCVASPAPVRLGVLGLGSSDPAVLQQARFPMPLGLPTHWGPQVRSRFAEAFFRRHSTGTPRPPVYESLGVAGRTTLPLNLELRTCYVAGLSVLQGSTKALLLEVTPSDRDGAADSTSEAEAVIVAFCTGDDGFARLRAEAVGLSVAWVAAVWRVEREVPLEGAP
jgi:hypothetical protein